MTSFSYHDDLKWHLSLLFRLPFCPFLDFSFVKEIFNSQTSTWSKISKNHDSQVFADLANQMIPRFIVFALEFKGGSFGAVEITAVHLFGDPWSSWVNVDLRCFANFFFRDDGWLLRLEVQPETWFEVGRNFWRKKDYVLLGINY